MHIFMKSSFRKHDLRTWHFALQTRFSDWCLLCFGKKALQLQIIEEVTRAHQQGYTSR